VPPAAWVELARRTSPPLLDDLKITAKVSQNLHAEMALRAVGLARRGEGSRQSRARGSERLPRLRRHLAGRLFARRWIRPGAVQPGDARHRGRLLRYMYDSPLRDAWLDLLPLGR
jgi:D-alanyl-D-alanine carboxypeptidase/D-alanyl-D-alanine-endopeptidase (penicillin-binding protein 4)